MTKTLRLTAMCGLGHVAGSVLVGSLGLAFGFMLVQLEQLQSFRGDLAAWLLIAAGTLYLAWGVVRAYRGKPHTHVHVHADGTVHCHQHVHVGDHVHVHEPAAEQRSPGQTTVAWALFIIFILGPCEPLIPLLIVPGARLSLIATVSIVLAYTVTTLATMIACVVCLTMATERLPTLGSSTQRWGHVYAGLAVLTCGILIKCGL